MTRKEAHRLVRITSGPLARVFSCPYCEDCTHTFRKSMVKPPMTWGEVAQVKAKIAAHIIENHPGRTA
jgi:hypothetical protein